MWTLCFQVNEGDLPLLPPVKGDSLFMVPQGIRPVVQLTAIEVSPWIHTTLLFNQVPTWHIQTRPEQPCRFRTEDKGL